MQSSISLEPGNHTNILWRIPRWNVEVAWLIRYEMALSEAIRGSYIAQDAACGGCETAYRSWAPSNKYISENLTYLESMSREQDWIYGRSLCGTVTLEIHEICRTTRWYRSVVCSMYGNMISVIEHASKCGVLDTGGTRTCGIQHRSTLLVKRGDKARREA